MSFLVYCIFPSVISYIYVRLYCILRNFHYGNIDRKNLWSKFLLCVLFDYLLIKTADLTLGFSYILRLVLLEILSGIDIHVRKIPTELLAAAGLISAIAVFRSAESSFPVLSAIVIGFVFFCFRKRIGIGLYDILLIVILGVTLQDPVLQLKFAALILILWGVFGLIIGVLKNRKDLSIPLVPLVTFSYYAVYSFL